MGRLHIFVMLLVAGCGRLGFDDMGGGGSGSQTTNLVPEVCSVQNYGVLSDAIDGDLSIAVTPNGAAVFVVPTSGGSLRGFTVDNDGNLTSGATIKTVRPSAGAFTASAAAYVDNTLIAVVISSSRALVHIIPADLSTYSEIGNVDGERVGKHALLHATIDRITPTACGAGLTVNPFDNSWNAQTSQLSVTSPQSTGIAATPLGNEALVAWSTADECYIERLTTGASGVGSSQAWSCNAPRLANDMTTVNSKIVFEATDGVRLGTIADDQLADSTTLLAAGGSSPRISFDGTSYWITYLDASGTLIAGTLQSDGSVLTTSVAGITPQHDAYELAIINGAPWTYSIDPSGTTAHKLCLAQQ